MVTSPRRFATACLLGVCLIGLASLLSGYTFKSRKQKADDDFIPPPYMALTRRALVGKDLGAAARFLKAARRCWQKRGQACGFPKYSYLLYLGVLTLQRGDGRRAVGLLKQAKAAWKRSPPKAPARPTRASKEAQQSHRRLGLSLSFYLGQAHFRSEQYEAAARALLEAAAIAGKMPGYYRLLARAQLEAKRYDDARRSLQKGLVAFPEDRGLLQIGALLYLRVGAWAAALSLGRRLLRATPKADATPFLVTVDAMRQAGLIYQVLPLLEEARLYMPRNPAILLRLGIAYSQAQMPIAAAGCFSALAPAKPEMAFYAAASWMQAGQLQRALLWNQRVGDPSRRARQRQDILLGLGQYAQALVSLERQWKQKQLPPQGRYRLAYVALRLGRYDLAQAVLASLKATAYAASARQLQSSLSLCRATPWRCLEP